jgi:glyoxylase-like metal-dependent hydrolase (beta-lactamase superfamily II)/rhodanese-related sulfurtransferase
MSATLPGFRQFRADGCLSYAFFDRESREAALIDPSLDLLDEYRELLAGEHLKLVSLIDTHTHADHFSATHALQSETGAEVLLSVRGSSERATRQLKDGDSIRVGDHSLRVLETPGHTPDSISLHYMHPASPLFFSGDTLLAGATGRTDFEGADPEALWSTLESFFRDLPDATLVCPAHGYSDILFSTIGTERSKNADWLLGSREEFVAKKRQESLTHPSEEIRHRLEFNRSAQPGQPVRHAGEGRAATQCGRSDIDAGRSAAISVEKYRLKVAHPVSGTALVDVREPFEFAEARIPGTRNLPLSEIAMSVGELLKYERVYLSCRSGRRSATVAKTLTYVGLPDVVNVTGGIQAWMHAGLPVEK